MHIYPRTKRNVNKNKGKIERKKNYLHMTLTYPDENENHVILLNFLRKYLSFNFNILLPKKNSINEFNIFIFSNNLLRVKT